MDKEKKFYSTKRKFINDGVFRAEVNELLQKAFADFGFSGIEVNFSKGKTEVRVLVSKFNQLMSRELKDTTNSIKVNELRGLIEQRFGFNKENSNHKFSLHLKRTFHRGIEAQEQAEHLKKRLLMGTPARSAAMNVIRNMLNKGAKGCEVIISGKLRQQRAKSMKYKDGFMIHTGQPKKVFISSAVRHLELKQGIMGIKVKIMLPYNPDVNKGKGFGVGVPLPDVITFKEQKNDEREERYDNRRERRNRQRDQDNQ
jgi:small subunit ribosomal protein S3e